MEGEKRENVYRNVISFLEQCGVRYEEYSHKPLFTMEETDEIYEGISEQQVKVIFARKYKTKSVYDFCLIVWTGSKKVDFAKIAEVLNVKKVGMATPEEVLEELEIQIGALSPIGYKKKCLAVVDKNLLRQPDLYINPGVHDKTIRMSAVDLGKLIELSASEMVVV